MLLIEEERHRGMVMKSI